MGEKLRIAILTTDGRVMSPKWWGEMPSFGTAPKALLTGFAELSDVEVHIVYCLRQGMPTPNELIPGIFLHQIVVPKIGWMSSLYAGCIKAVRARLAEIKPDIVHGQGTERDCAMEAVYSGFPNVLTIHGIMHEIQRLGYSGHALYGRLAALLETHALRRTRGVFCNSTYTQALIAPRARHTWLVPNPIRSAFFDLAQGTTSRHSVPRLLNVGLISPRKRQLEILRLIGDINRGGCPVHVTFVGDWNEESDYGAAFGEEIRKAESRGYATYAGILEEPALIALMDESDGFVHFPSEESFGLVVAEALARGLKLFGSNLGGIRDIALGIKDAELYDDFDSLRRGITTWISAGALRPPTGAKEIEARYHPSIVARRHVEIYREVLER